MKGEGHALGLWGEAQVADWLLRRGYQMKENRWRCRYGEIDLIGEKEGFLCFVEVKLRKDDRFAPARAFVTQAKQEKLRIAAQLYMQEYPTELQPRFDVAEVYAPFGRQTENPQIIYWENAF